MLRVVLSAVTGTVPSQANISQLNINTVIAILLRTPLYLIEAALLLSPHGQVAVPGPHYVYEVDGGFYWVRGVKFNDEAKGYISYQNL